MSRKAPSVRRTDKVKPEVTDPAITVTVDSEARADEDSNALSLDEMAKVLQELQQNQIDLYSKNLELRRVREELEIARGRYFDLYNMAPVGYLTLAQDHTITEANATTATLLAMTADTLIGNPLGSFVLEQDRPIYHQILGSPPARDDLQSGELRMQRFANEPLWVRLIISRAADTILRVVLIDITKRKEAEESLRQTEEKFHKAFDLNPDLMGISRLRDGRIVSVNKNYSTITGFSVDEVVGSTSLELSRWAHPEDHDRLEARLRQERSVLNFEAEFRTKNGKKQIGLISQSIFELDGEEHVISNFRDITERKRAETELLAANQKLSLQFEQAPIGVIEWDLNFNVVRWNPAAERIFGYSEQQARGKRFDFIVPAEGRGQVDLVVEHILKGTTEGDRSTNQNIRSDGTLILCDWYNAVLTDAKGNTIGAISLIDDVTQRRQAEAELQASADRFRRLADVSPTPITEIDPARQQVIYLNKAFTRIFGYTQEELANTNDWFELAYPDPEYRKHVRQTWSKQLQLSNASSELFEPQEYRIVAKDGSVHYAVLSAAPLGTDFSGPYIVAYQDITERKSNEQKLQLNEQRFRSLVEASPTPTIEVDAQRKILYVNDAFIRTFGYNLNDIPTISDWYELAYPDATYREHVRTTWLKQFERSNTTGQRFEPQEYRIRCKNGEELNVILTAAALNRDFSENYIVNFQDITERKRNEEQLRASERQLRETIEANPVPSALNDGDGNIIHLNTAFVRLFGYSQEDLPNLQSWWPLAYPDPAYQEVVAKEWAARMSAAQHTGREFEPLEVKIQCKDNRQRFVIVSASPLGAQWNAPHLVTFFDITERKQAELAIEESENRFRLAFDLSPDSMVINRLNDGAIVAVNQAYTNLTGHTAEESAGRTSLELGHWVNLEDRQYYLAELHGKGIVKELKTQFRTKTGSVIDGVITAMTFNSGGVAHYIGTIRDVTEKNRANAALVARERKFRSVFDLSPDATSINRLDDGSFVSINKGFTQLTGYTSEEIIGHCNKDFGLWGEVGNRSMLLQRLHAEGTVAGIEMSFVTKTGSVRRGLMSAATIDIEGVPHYVASVHDITDRNEALTQLKESEERYRSLTKVSSDWYWEQDDQFRFVRVDGSEDTTRGPGDLFLNQTRWSVPALNLDEAGWAAHRAVLERHEPFYDFEMLRIDEADKEFWVSISGTPIFDETGKFTGYRGVGHNITLRKQAEALAKTSAEMFQQSFDLIPDSMSVVRLTDEVIVGVNQQFRRVTGYDSTELVGRTSAELNRWVNPEQRRIFIDTLKNGQSISDFVVELRNKDGSIMTAVLMGAPITISDVPHGISSYRDITEQRRMEQALRQSERLLREAQEAAHIGSYSMSLTTGTWESSSVMDKLFGIDADYPHTVDGWAGFIHPEDAVNMERVIRDVIREPKPFDAEYRIIRPNDGVERWMHGLGKIGRDDQGLPIALTGTVQDITERKQAEAAIKRNEAQFRIVFDLNPDPMYLNRGADNTFVAVNQGFTVATGYTADDVQGKTSRDIEQWVNPEDRATLIRRLNRDGEVTNYEATLRKKSGEVQQALLSVRSIDINGEAYFITNFRDITEQKKTEEALRRNEQMFRMAFDLNPDAMALATLKDGRFVLTSKNFTTVSGYTEAEAVGKTAKEMGWWVDPESREAMLKVLRREKSVVDHEAKFRTKDGQIIDGLVRASLLDINGETHIISTLRDITARKQDEQQIRDNEQRFRAVFNLSPDAVMVVRAEDSVFVAVNRGYTQITGYSVDETVGYGAAELNRWVYPEERVRHKEITLKNRAMADVEVQLRHKNGAIVDILMSSIVVDLNGVAHIISSMRDITARSQFQRMVRENEEKFRRAFDVSPDSMTLIRVEDNTLIAVNRGFTELSGYTAEEAVGSSAVPVQRWQDPKHRDALMATALSGETVRNVEVKMRHKNGAVRDCLVSLTPTEFNGKPHVLSSVRDVTDQKRLLKHLQESEEKFRRAFDVSPDAVHINRLDNGLIVAVSRGFTELFGHAQDEAIGRSSIELGYWAHPSDRTPFVERLERERSVFGYEGLFRTKTGRVFSGLVSSSIIELNGIEHTLSSLRDISEQQRATAELRSSEVKFRKAFDLSPYPMSLTRLDDGLYRALSKAYANLVERPEEEAIGRTAVELGVWANPDDRIKMVEHIQRNGEIRNYETKFCTKRGKIIDVELTGTVIDIESTPHILVTARETSEQKRVSEELRTSEERFRRAFDLSPEAIVISRIDNRTIVAVNQSYCQVSGYDAKESVGRTTANLRLWVNPEDEDRLLQKVKKEGSVRNERVVFRSKIGRHVETLISLARITLDGVAHIIALVSDITAQAEAERSLRQSEEQLRRIFDLSPDAMTISRRDDGTLIAVNQGFTRLTGYEPNEAVGKTTTDLRLFRDASDRKALLDTIDKHGMADNFEAKFRNKQGDWRDCAISIGPVDFDGEPCLLAVVRENTAHVQALQVLQQSEQLQRVFVENAPMPLAMLDREMRYLSVSQRWRTLTGLDPNQNLSGLYHYELLPWLPEHWRDAHRRGLAGEVVRSNLDHLDLPDGTVQWMRWEVRPWHTPDGEVGGVILFREDLTDLHRTEAELRQREHLLQIFVENSPASMIMLDRQLRYVSMSRRWQENFGLDGSTLIGSKHYDLLGNVPKHWQDAHARGLAGETVQMDEDHYERPDGTLQWMRWEVRPWHDSNGEIGGIMIFVENIPDPDRP